MEKYIPYVNKREFNRFYPYLQGAAGIMRAKKKKCVNLYIPCIVFYYFSIIHN